jgi:predicted DNA-binding transcriptional regulator AlpA
MANPKERVTMPKRIVDTSKLDDDAHVKIETVSRETGLAKGTIRNLISKTPPGFPPPVPKDAPGPNYWILGHIRAWLRSERGRKK